MMEAFGRRLTQFPPLWRWVLLGQLKKDQVEIVEPLIALSQKCIGEARADPDIAEKDSLLARVLEEEEVGRLSTDELSAQFLLLQNAGFDTTSGTLRWALLALALHSDIADRIRAETHADLNSAGLLREGVKLASWTFTQQVHFLPLL